MARISGGNDKQGFSVKRGVLTHGRVCLLLSKGHACYRPRRTGERKGKLAQCFIVDANSPLRVLNLVIVKKKKKKKKKRRIVLVSLIPKELAESANFSVSVKKMLSANTCEKAPKQRRQQT